ncbi:MAG: hypothetical protein DBP02_07235 [gamma proteobacterium symbiont of Ctena orbiculata]|nr:MAG: hypothetical protein DBP02_07235 [gamma proteobacterium symbiont of Ctena orbiculata]
MKIADQKNTLSRQSGHIALEYALVTFILVMFLFAPVTDDNQSVMGLFMDSIRDYDRNRSLIYSLP